MAVMLLGGASFAWAYDAPTGYGVSKVFIGSPGSPNANGIITTVSVENYTNVESITGWTVDNNVTVSLGSVTEVPKVAVNNTVTDAPTYVAGNCVKMHRTGNSKSTLYAKYSFSPVSTGYLVFSGDTYNTHLTHPHELRFEDSAGNLVFYMCYSNSSGAVNFNIYNSAGTNIYSGCSCIARTYSAWGISDLVVNLSTGECSMTMDYTGRKNSTNTHLQTTVAFNIGTGHNIAALKIGKQNQNGYNTAMDTYLDNVALYSVNTYSDLYSAAKAEYDTKVASLDAVGQAYWTANVTSAASITTAAQYKSAVDALPTTYIAAVKAQTTPSADMTECLKTAVSNDSWTGATGTYGGVAAERYAGDNSHFSTGNIITQTVSGLHAGYYRVKFYGVANRARNIAEEYYGEGIAQMFANSETLDVEVINQAACSPITDTYLRTFEVYLSEDNSSIEFGIKNIKEGGQWYVAQALSLTYLGTSLYDYTINYKFNDVTIKSTEGSAALGETINAISPITISDQKYYATSATSMEIEAGENVLNVILRKADTWNYTVRAVNSTAGVINDNLASGSVTEGESTPKFFFPRFVLKGTTLYCSKTGATWYSDVITPDGDDYVFDVNYNQTPVNNVAFYIEAEDVTGVTKGTNADRASMGKMGYTGGADTYKEVTTLTPGKYILYSRCQNGNNSARNFNFKVGDKIVHTGSQTKGTNGDTTSDEFTVNTSSTLSFASEGSDQSGVDYFYLVKTADFASIGAKNYTTFASAYPLDCSALPDGLTAYYVEAEKIDKSNSVVKLTAATEAVAAGTGLLLKGDANEDYYIPVAATSGIDLSSTNKMIGCTTATTLTSTSPNVSNFYVLVNGATAPEFQNIAAYVASNNVTIPAGKAYLDATGVETSRLSIVFDDNETTGIRLTENSELRTENVVYDLQGRRVMNAQKGLYIVNGKKVVIK